MYLSHSHSHSHSLCLSLSLFLPPSPFLPLLALVLIDDDDAEVANLAGSIVGGFVAFVLFIVMFFLFSKTMSDKSNAIGTSLTGKTTSPLAGVQIVVLFIATAFAFSLAFSPEAVTVVLPAEVPGASGSVCLFVCLLD